jgi:predicted dehydrogenase
MSDSTSASNRSTRRTFIKTAATVAGAAAVAGLPGCAGIGGRRRQPRRTVPAVTVPRREKLRVAYIGTAGVGGWHVEKTHELGVDCPCYCDVDTHRMQKAAELYPNARAYQDYRRMFDREHKNFDAVMIGIPDHHHYPATVIALQHGKHVYTQKPLTHTPWEARQLADAAVKYRVATQMGNQGHALEGWRLIYEWYHSGALGDVTEVHTWTNRPGRFWPQGMERPEGEDPVPANLDWDVWLGPAPVRPYKGPDKPDENGPYHPFNWRGWWDFGCGALGDMACHTMDCLFAALDPGYCTAVEPVAMTPMNGESFPKAAAIKWEFPRRGWRRAFDAYWYDGDLRPRLPADLELDRRLPQTGLFFVGTQASLLVAGDYGNSPRIIPEAKMKEIGKPPQMLERSPGPFEEWIMAAKGEKPIDYPKSNFTYSGPMTETILLGNIALRMGRRLEWNGAKMEFTNVPEANQYVRKEYRPGWKFDL